MNINPSNVDVVKENVQTLIGFFNLDPNRVLDIILDSFENNLWNHGTYIRLLEGQFQSQTIAQVIGFKFQNYLEHLISFKADKSKILTEEALAKLIPKGLFTMVALLLKHDIVHLEDVWPHLGI